MSREEDLKAYKKMVKDVYDDNEAEINGTSYTFTKFVHKERRTVFAFYTSVAREIESGSMAFLDYPQFEKIEKLICDKVLVDGSQISKLPNYWEDHPEDYITLMTTAMSVISYPFTKGNNGV